MKKIKEKKLTGKQQAFCEAYVANKLNATLAAQLAEYKGNHHTLENIGYENVRKPGVKAEISRLLEARRQKTAYTRAANEAEANEVIVASKEAGDRTTWMQGVVHKARLYGHLVEHKRHEMVLFKPPAEPQARKAWLEDQLEALRRAEAAPIALATGSYGPPEDGGGGGKPVERHKDKPHP